MPARSAALPFRINWLDPAFYKSPKQFCPAIANVVIAMSSLLNPHSVVLHGSFLSSIMIEMIHEIVREELPLSSVPQIIFSKDFTLDFEVGMITETLAHLEPQLFLTHSV